MKSQGLLLLILTLCAACHPRPRQLGDVRGGSSNSAARAAGEYEARFLTDTARAATAAGAGPLHVAGFGAATTGDSIEGFVAISEKACILAFARGSASIEDLDLHAYGDDGTEFGVDESPDDLPTLLLCSKEAGRVFLAARVAQGKGLVSLGVQEVPRSRVDGVARAVGARNHLGDVTESKETWPGLEAKIALHRSEIGGEWVDQRRVAVPLDPRVPTHVSFSVPERGCLDLVVLPSAELAQIQMELLDEHGRIFTRARRGQDDLNAILCNRGKTQDLTLRLRPYAGRGLAVAAFSITKEADRGWPNAEQVLFLNTESAPPPPAALGRPARRHEFSLTLGSIQSWEVSVDGCTRIELLPKAALQATPVRVWSDAGALLAEGDAALGTPLFVCHQGTIRAEAETSGPPGKLVVELRPEREAVAPVLTRYPLAASRLLAAAHDSALLSMPHDIGRVEHVPLTDTQLSRLDLSVPASHCQTFFFAKDRGGWGVEARVIDPESGELLDFARGATSTSVRVCAGRGNHLRAALEVRTVRGQTDALWSSRQEKLE